MPDPEVVKARLRQQGFLPDPVILNTRVEKQDRRVRAAVEPSPLYLKEIDKKLDKIIELLQSRQDT